MSDHPNIPGHTIKKCIGKGGMGEVYLGVQHSLGRSVALKVTLASLAEHDENFAERFVTFSRLAFMAAHMASVTNRRRPSEVTAKTPCSDVRPARGGTVERAPASSPVGGRAPRSLAGQI